MKKFLFFISCSLFLVPCAFSQVFQPTGIPEPVSVNYTYFYNYVRVGKGLIYQTRDTNWKALDATFTHYNAKFHDYSPATKRWYTRMTLDDTTLIKNLTGISGGVKGFDSVLLHNPDLSNSHTSDFNNHLWQWDNASIRINNSGDTRWTVDGDKSEVLGPALLGTGYSAADSNRMYGVDVSSSITGLKILLYNPLGISNAITYGDVSLLTPTLQSVTTAGRTSSNSIAITGNTGGITTQGMNFSVSPVTGAGIIRINDGAGGLDDVAIQALTISLQANNPTGSTHMTVGHATIDSMWKITYLSQYNSSSFRATNEDTTNLIGYINKGSQVGQMGRIKLGSGLSITNGVLSSTGGSGGWGYSGYIATLTGASKINMDGYPLTIDSSGGLYIKYYNSGADSGRLSVTQGFDFIDYDADWSASILANSVQGISLKMIDQGTSDEIGLDINEDGINLYDASLAGASNGYVWKLADQTTGRGEWGAESQDLQAVTDVGNSTNNTIDVTGEGHYSDNVSNVLKLYRTGSGIGRLESLGAGSTRAPLALRGSYIGLFGTNSASQMIVGYSNASGAYADSAFFFGYLSLHGSVFRATNADTASLMGYTYRGSSGGNIGKILIGSGLTLTNGVLSASGVGGVDWGDIGGTLSDQTDLQGALDNKQDADAELSQIAATTPADGDFIQRVGGGYTNRTTAQVKTTILGNAFFEVTGPTTSTKTFTFPNASATILYDGGALGTPASGTMTNVTGLPLATGVTGTLPGANGGTGVANTGKTLTLSGNTVLGSSTHTITFNTSGNTSITFPTSGTILSNNSNSLSSSDVASIVSDEIGSGALVFGTSPDFTTSATIGGVAIPTISSTNTLTNKRFTPRYSSTTSSATPTINTDNVDVYEITAQTVNITSMTTNLSGTPTADQTLHIIITGTAARTISWGSSFEASTIALPTTTVTTNRLDTYFIWNTVTSKWRISGVW